MDENNLFKKDVNIDMKAFLGEEEARLASDWIFVAKMKSAAKEKKIMTILTVIVICISAIGSAAYFKGSEYQREKERKYKAALVLQEREMYEDAIGVYDKLYGYKDSDSRISVCEKKMEEAETKSAYENAMKNYEDEDFLSAAVLFSEIKEYEDSQQKALESYYKYGEECVEKGEYEIAYNAFVKAEDYNDAEQLAEKYKFSVVEVGDTIALGKYEQDGDASNGEEDLVWYVLYKEGDQALLLSKYVLELLPFNAVSEDQTSEDADESTKLFTYADSTIRTFVNETFYNTAFTEEEKELLVALSVIEKDLEGNELAVSENRVFLLDAGMVDQFLTKDSMKIAKGTEVVKATYRYDEMPWWTSTINRTNGTKAIAILGDGYAYSNPFNVYCGIRPAIWVDFVK